MRLQTLLRYSPSQAPNSTHQQSVFGSVARTLAMTPSSPVGEWTSDLNSSNHCGSFMLAGISDMGPIHPPAVIPSTLINAAQNPPKEAACQGSLEVLRRN